MAVDLVVSPVASHQKQVFQQLHRQQHRRDGDDLPDLTLHVIHDHAGAENRRHDAENHAEKLLEDREEQDAFLAADILPCKAIVLPC